MITFPDRVYAGSVLVSGIVTLLVPPGEGIAFRLAVLWTSAGAIVFSVCHLIDVDLTDGL